MATAAATHPPSSSSRQGASAYDSSSSRPSSVAAASTSSHHSWHASTHSHDVELNTMRRPSSVLAGDSTAADTSTPASAAATSRASLVAPGEPTTLRKVSICASTFFITFTTCGAVFSFGVYQDLYQIMSTQPDTPFTGASPAIIDLIGTLTAAFMMLGGPLAIGWTKAFSPRRVIFTGAVLYFAASMLASVSQRLWQFILTQGMLAGIATCSSYMPAVTVAPMWFGKNRGLAMGIALAGTGVGGLVFSPFMQALNESLGFRNSLRVSGAVTTVCIVVGGIVLDWDPTTKARMEAEKSARSSTRRSGGSSSSRWRAFWDIPLVNWRLARSTKFTAQVVAGLLQAAAYYTPVFFFSAYARTLGYSASAGAGFIAVNNACNAVGKIAFGIIADRIGRVNMLLITTAVSAVASFALWLPSTLTASHTSAQGLFITYAITYGAFASAYVSLFPAALIEVFGPQNFASVNGLLYMVRGMGSMIGTPSAGAMIRSSAHAAMPSGYLNMSILVGCLLAGATGGVMWLRIEQAMDKQ